MLSSALNGRNIRPLAAIILSLIAIGFVSNTPLRHAVQVIPGVVALALALRRSPVGPDAALPIYLFWLPIMVGIWLFLLGVSRILKGHFTPAEIALTMVIAACCVWGIAESVRKSVAHWTTRSAVFTLFLALQLAAMWLSTRPSISHR
jgi:hypothetical protein